tara:strand:- start:79 stop:483 length:405 start_codon:yes stop_codon:yes gene_type:complete
MTWIPPRTEDIASPLNPFYNLTNSEVQQVNPELSKKLKESKMNRKEHLDLNEAIANVWTGGQQDIQEGEELITEEMLVEELTNDITTVVESIQEEVGFELSEDEINYIVDTLLEAEDEEEDEDEDEDKKKKMMK